MEQISKFDVKKTKDFVEDYWNKSIQPGLEEFIRIPNISRSFDKDWNTNGLLEKAANHYIDWMKKQDLKGLQVKLLTAKDKTPMVYADIPGFPNNTQPILIYGHIDKQPYGDGWKTNEGICPTQPKVIGDRIYGRGANDDGYAGFGAIAALKACQIQNIPHPRTILLLEADEESGSNDFAYYLDQIKKDFGGDIAIVFCLDAGCMNYETLWVGTSLRGVVSVTFTVKVLKEGVHSGDASGIIPSSFRIIRQILDRIEDPKTGQVVEDLQVVIPPKRYQEAVNTCMAFPDILKIRYPFIEGMKSVHEDIIKNYLARTWTAQVAYTGIDGIPSTQLGGNVLRPYTTLKLSIRIPPTLNLEKARAVVLELLTKNVPYNAEVTINSISTMSGWSAPINEPYLDQIINSASNNFFGQNVQCYGGGGSIPLMKFLNDLFPKSQFMVTGIEGPGCNAHGPNESLYIPGTKKLICSLTQVLTEVSNHLKI